MDDGSFLRKIFQRFGYDHTIVEDQRVNLLRKMFENEVPGGDFRDYLCFSAWVCEDTGGQRGKTERLYSSLSTPGNFGFYRGNRRKFRSFDRYLAGQKAENGREVGKIAALHVPEDAEYLVPKEGLDAFPGD